MTIEPKRLTPEELARIDEDYMFLSDNKSHDIHLLMQHIAYQDGLIEAVKDNAANLYANLEKTTEELERCQDARPRVLPVDFMDRLANYDNLVVCSVCGDQYTTASHGMCNSCYDQSIIDEIG